MYVTSNGKERRNIKCRMQTIETICSCVFMKSGSTKNVFLLKSPCGDVGIGSMISGGREDPEESLEKGIWKTIMHAEMKSG